MTNTTDMVKRVRLRTLPYAVVKVQYTLICHIGQVSTELCVWEYLKQYSGGTACKLREVEGIVV